MIKDIKGGYEETLKRVTKTYKWIEGRGYIEIPKCSLGKESKNEK